MLMLTKRWIGPFLGNCRLWGPVAPNYGTFTSKPLAFFSVFHGCTGVSGGFYTIIISRDIKTADVRQNLITDCEQMRTNYNVIPFHLDTNSFSFDKQGEKSNLGEINWLSATAFRKVALGADEPRNEARSEQSAFSSRRAVANVDRKPSRRETGSAGTIPGCFPHLLGSHLWERC